MDRQERQRCREPHRQGVELEHRRLRRHRLQAVGDGAGRVRAVLLPPPGLERPDGLHQPSEPADGRRRSTSASSTRRRIRRSTGPTSRSRSTTTRTSTGRGRRRPSPRATPSPSTVNVPANTPYGMYEGSIVATKGSQSMIVPVAVTVAATAAQNADGSLASALNFGGTAVANAQASSLYNNGSIFGANDWTWRQESGDWRFFYYNVAQHRAGRDAVPVRHDVGRSDGHRPRLAPVRTDDADVRRRGLSAVAFSSIDTVGGSAERLSG